MKNSVAQAPVNLKAIRTALIVGGYTEIEILTAVRSLARERILRLLPDQQLARISRN